MKFGTKVWVTRGGSRATRGFPGSQRKIRGVLIGARGTECIVRLEENDFLDTVGWSVKGSVGHWSRSAVEERKVSSP